MTQVMLVAMPWTVTQAPSIQLGILTSLLRREGLATEAAHFYVAFYDEIARHLPGRKIALDFYNSFGEALGEWTFSVPPFRKADAASDAAWRALAASQHSPAWADLAFRVRALVPAFLERCADEILDARPQVVGFSTTFQQTVPSLVLAKLLKQRSPSTQIVFGGANCEGEMGAGLHRLFPWIDVVVRGEAENVAQQLFRELVDGAPVTPGPGLCVRTPERVVDEVAATPRRRELVQLGREIPAAPAPVVAMTDVPVPNYDDYFARLRRSPLAGQVKHWLPYESARGCWWAVTKVCTFCAANATYTTFRSKPPSQVKAEVEALSAKYQSPNVWFVDNIMDERYMRELFPAMQGHRDDLAMFAECRAHVSRDQLAAMREAGVVEVQLGVESFSTAILRQIDKGTSAIQNLRVIKWCAELGIHAFYNVIYGFPGEAPEEYERMAQLVPSLLHLEPPNTPVALRLDRFSPYFKRPAHYGIGITGPRPSRTHVLGLPPNELEQIEYFFMFEYLDGRKPAVYAAAFLAACETWRTHARASFGRLGWRAHGDRMRIHDLRSDRPPRRYDLEPTEARIYHLCNAGATAADVHSKLSAEERTRVDVAAIDQFLDVLVARGLAFRDGKKVLALAVDAAAPGIPPISSELVDALPATTLTLTLPTVGACA